MRARARARAGQQDKLELGMLNKPGSTLAPTCFAFPENDTTRFLLGTEEGTIYHANRTEKTHSAGYGPRPRVLLPRAAGADARAACSAGHVRRRLAAGNRRSTRTSSTRATLGP